MWLATKNDITIYASFYITLKLAIILAWLYVNLLSASLAVIPSINKKATINFKIAIGPKTYQTQQVDVFSSACVRYYNTSTHTTYHWYNSTVKINRLISNYGITIKSRDRNSSLRNTIDSIYSGE